jgi:hypothetical protein
MSLFWNPEKLIWVDFTQSIIAAAEFLWLKWKKLR